MHNPSYKLSLNTPRTEMESSLKSKSQVANELFIFCMVKILPGMQSEHLMFTLVAEAGMM